MNGILCRRELRIRTDNNWKIVTFHTHGRRIACRSLKKQAAPWLCLFAVAKTARVAKG